MTRSGVKPFRPPSHLAVRPENRASSLRVSPRDESNKNKSYEQNSLNILLLEDEEAHIQLILRVFESRADVRLTVARTLREARTRLAADTPDLMIIDLLLPDGRGIDLLKETRRNGSLFPAVIMTSHGDEAVAVEAMKAGALDYFVKSVESFANMPRLADRAIREWDHIAERRAAEERLRESNRQLRESEERLRVADRAKSEFLTNMSHELRTPMTVFMTAVDLLLQVDEVPEHRQLLEMADTAAHRLLNLIDDILDVSQIDAGRLKIRQEPFDLSVCVQRAADMFTLQARRKNLKLAVEIAPDVPPIVTGDPDRLGQILVNLIGNAVKFTHKGEVTISVQADRQRLHFAVRDTGIGIPQEKMHLLFQTFTQVDSSLTRRFGGTGLGLAISKRLAELMRGSVKAESREGEGSTFVLTVPLLPGDRTVPADPKGTTVPIGGACHIRVLIAEDDPAIQRLVTMILSRRGYQVVTAESGHDAVAKWQNGDIDVILMDVQMPDMGGLEATGQIRALEEAEGRHTCIIAMTAHARKEDEQACISAGMDGFLAKPVRISAVVEAIESCFV
ncbi:MAG: response regulator [Desulfuromonadales bacterium]|nr:response regulator [Desulfuromonadales bacterium]